MTAKVIKLIRTMDPDDKIRVRDAIRGRIRRVINAEAINQLSEAVASASRAGLDDEEIMQYVQETLQRRAHERQVAHALKYHRRLSAKTS